MKQPEYTGSALSRIGNVLNPPGYPPLWMWTSLWEPSTRKVSSSEAVNTLIQQGWMKTTSGEGVAETQLYKTIVLVKHDEQNQHRSEGEIWYQPDQDTRTLTPTILAFSVTPPSAMYTTIPMLNPLPLPQLGEYGLVEDNEFLVAYSILDLHLEARQRWQELGEAIRELSSPLQWPAFTETHRIASDDQLYHTFLQNLAALDDTKGVQSSTKELQTARTHIEALRKALSKATWFNQWQEVKRMVRALAQDYYDHHQQTATRQIITPLASITKTETTLPSWDDLAAPSATQSLPTEEPPKKRRGRRPHTTPTSIVAKGKEELTIRSDILNREIINALRDKTTYTPYPEQRVAEHRHQFYQKDKGQIIITIQPLADESWETVLDGLNTLGDGCIDTYIAAMAIAIDRNGTEPPRIRTPFSLSPDDILAVCGKQKSNGSYTAFQRADVIKHLKTLSQTRVIATIPGPGRKRGRKLEPTVIRAEGALIDLLSFKIGEYRTITGEEIWEKRSIAIGEWATMIPELNAQTAMMFRQVLAYSAKNERYQKRLGVYLTFMFRINARHGGTFPNDITMEALLEGAGIVPPREQGHFREAIENALERLKRDNVIGNYWRVIETTLEAQKIDREVQEHARGWFASYLKQKWNFFPPEAIKKQYRNLLKESSEKSAK
jgi:hypothetical protein